MSAHNSELDNLEEEIKELLLNYKHKKPTIYEPCTLNNIKECLIGLHEELALLNINYVFNPYVDMEMEAECLHPDALVKLINAMWSLLHHHKNSNERVERLTDQNHTLEQTNKQLNGSDGQNGALSHLKEKFKKEQNESRACVASAQRISDQSDDVVTKLTETRAKLEMSNKKKESLEKSLRNEIKRLKIDNEKLLCRLSNKSSSYTPCSEVCDSTLVQLKNQDRKQRAVINKLQNNNEELVREVLALKENIILSDYNK